MTHPLPSALIVNLSYDKNAAVVVLPPVAAGRLADQSLRAWLAKSDLQMHTGRKEILANVLDPLGLPYPEAGLAALRMWGQTGDRPTTWIAAADPVYLEPQLDRLRVHALRRSGVLPREMRILIDHLQATLATDNRYGFARLGSYCYVSAKEPIATASVPAYVVDLESPNAYLASGEGSAATRNLVSEIEMSLHEHEINLARETAGKQPINSLWIWGGGTAPIQETRPQPPLFSDDALLTGYWNAATGVAEPWPGDIASCLEASVAGFVAETPEFDDRVEVLEYCLAELHDALSANRLSRLTLLFRDGVTAVVEKKQARRVWRRNDSLLD